jgi:hypothetical protein
MAVFTANQTVKLTATAQPGYMFTGWSGDCSGVILITNVIMSQAQTCSATFATQRALTVNVAGTGSVLSNPVGINCIGSCTRNFADGQTINLVATPVPGYQFERWADDCSGTQTSASVTMSRPMTCTAIFTSGWARWPMPNPVSTGLPNPQYYDTSVAGVVLDRVTGLMWERNVDAGMYSWSEAQGYCTNLVTGGFHDWRLPSRIEIWSIFDPSQAAPFIDPIAFPATPADYFWTTSSSMGGNARWYFHFGRLGSNRSLVDKLYRVRCVRVAAPPASNPEGDTPPLRYMVQSGTVFDKKTKLTWQQALQPADAGTFTTHTAAEATSYCSALDLNGGGWRLPSVKELATIVDEQGNVLYIDQTAFPNTPNVADKSRFWSSSQGPVSGLFAIDFGNALFSEVFLSDKNFTRCVR